MTKPGGENKTKSMLLQLQRQWTWRLQSARKNARRLLRRAWSTVTVAQVREALALIVPAPRPVLLVHSSLSACGHLRGGAAAVIQTLGEIADTLCMPTHTYCYPPDPATPGPIFDPTRTESVVGEITNAFWRMPGVIRSIHPSHSLAARGPRAPELCAGHERCATPCGAQTPYEKLVQCDASVLMFGARMDAYTLFHVAEDAAGCPYLYESRPYDLRAKDEAGAIHPVTMLRQNMGVTRRFAAMDGILEGNGLLHRTRLGRGELLYVPSAGEVHRFLLEKLRNDPYYLVDLDYRRRLT